MDKITCSKTGKRWQVYLAHVPKTINTWREDFLINLFQMSASQTQTKLVTEKHLKPVIFQGRARAFKEREQNCLVTACQDHTPGTSTTVNLQAISEPRGLMLSRSWIFCQRLFKEAHVRNRERISADKSITKAVKVICLVFFSILLLCFIALHQLRR